MKLVVGADERDAASRAADLVAAHARAAAAARGRFLLAASGGRAPAALFDQLARREGVPWEAVHLLQVDERVAPSGDPARNAELLTRQLGPVVARLAGLHLAPVDQGDPAAAAEAYGRALVDLAGDPPVLDLVHLGLGGDGHTASLVPGDPVLDVVDRPVAATAPYQGHRRVTLTRPVLDAARHRLWFVLGDSKRAALAALLRHDPSVPAGLLRGEATTAVVDRAALGLAPPEHAGPPGGRRRRPG